MINGSFKKQNNTAGSTPLPVIGLILVIIIVALVGIVVSRHHTKPTTTTASTGSAGTPAAAASGTPLSISELGVKVVLPASLSKTTYTVDTPPPNVSVSPPVRLQLDTYTALANKCLGEADNTEQDFAILAKTNSRTPVIEPGVTLLKQFSDFYISDIGSSVPPSANCQDATTKSQLDKLSSNLNSSLQAAFKNAQKL